MTVRLARRCFILTSSLLFTAVAGAPALGRGAPNNLVAQPVFVAKEANTLATEAKFFLTRNGATSSRVWVFFTDKGVASQGDFAARAASVTLSEKVLKRRAKVGLDHIVFADLPVQERYVASLTALGGTVRATSRWLNAASVEIANDKLDQISALPFVASIQPVVTFTRPLEAVDANSVSPQSAQSVDVLNYGSSATQLNQIAVPAVHNKGYHGEGVTLAMFDTGFRKSHEAFAQAYAENRVLAEYDFVFNDSNTANQPIDDPTAWDHGTFTWSTAAGYKDGVQAGPAFKANYLLAKTEDVRSETRIEEDNWVRALEWADPLGVDVISCSLGYSDWYTYVNMDGATATITLAANTCAGLGIVLCNSMGNAGPNPGTLSAPADAFNIVAVGAVNSAGSLAGFSSRGPTYDGRMKPEVCARGVSTYCASSASDNSYTSVSGTSLSTPLVAGAACLLVQARPTFTPYMIREALMMTASQASAPDNNYGWGIINADAALSWPVAFSGDVVSGTAPLSVNFTATPYSPASSWAWNFGDGGTASVQNPSHTYTTPGVYTVGVTVGTSYGLITTQKANYVFAFGDTLALAIDSSFAGKQMAMSFYLTNSQPLNQIDLAFKWTKLPLAVVFDSLTRGSRTAYFESFTTPLVDRYGSRYVVSMKADAGGGSLPLPPGSGEVAKLYVTPSKYAYGGIGDLMDTCQAAPYKSTFYSPYMTYQPPYRYGLIATRNILRGDANYDWLYDISDVFFLVDMLSGGGSQPVTIQSGDWTRDNVIDISDLFGLIDYLTGIGPLPVYP